ncbi:hypothetical protein [Paraburkholderia largidicola]|uniref:Porin n=1 Tax=Paraburkholderia largidicola TaxID=3014751 RepID=A0A7I8BVU2_9BURK|nr:hypothetical protein [Paraburkholderia sp. PGU16]BCF92907.1 hypothetical protein PPGU16_59740 [Paraburkholderia sp. PGU16]BEU26079.1 hypothetical protein PBP221_62190 [Paraburkholderia sp. 22B1P]
MGAAWSHVDVYGPTGNVWIDNSSLANGASWPAWKFDNFEVSTQYHFMPNFWLGAVYTFTMAHLTADNGNYNPKWHHLSFMVDYDVSTRTSFYVQGVHQHVISAHTGTSFDEARIVDASAGTSSGVNQMVFRIGIMHTF